MFYLTFPSNSSIAFFPDNTLTHYVTHLPKPIDLDGKWEVGLVEIQYPHTWYNVQKECAWIVYRGNATGQTLRKTLKEGLYETPTKLIDYLNREMTDTKNVKFHYDLVSKKVSLYVAPGAFVKISKTLNLMLGLDQTRYDSGLHLSKHVVDVNQGFYSLYIYSSIVESRMVGDTMACLLYTSDAADD